MAGQVVLPGADPQANRYSVGASWTGDLTKARSELAACGHRDGFTIRADMDNPNQFPAMELVRTALGRVGIKLSLAGSCQDSYYCASPCFTFPGAPPAEERIALVMCTWTYDFPTTNAFWYPIAHTPAGSETGTLSPLQNAAVDAAIDRSLTVPPDQWAAAGQAVDRAVMDTATLLPYLFVKATYYRSARLANVYVSRYGGYDLVNLGVGGE